VEEKDRVGLLKDEYFQLQKVVEDYDLRALTIKAWSVTFSAAGLVTAYLQNARILLLIAALSALVFWIVEALWKTNQQAYYPRIWKIERHFRDAGTEKAEEIRPFAIGLSWGDSFRKEGSYWRSYRIMLWPHVALPHAVVAVVGVLLFFCWPPTG
jgi:hypothetical protein